MLSLRNNWQLATASLLGGLAFVWPVLLPMLTKDASEYAGYLAVAIAVVAVIALLIGSNPGLMGSKQLAMLGLLAAVGAGVRIATSGVGGFEAVFIVIILAGRAFGARFGFLLGMLTIAASSIFWGGIGPWTAFQMLAVGWVGLGAGLLPAGKKYEIPILAGYAVTSSYFFGLVMNLWFWPIAVGPETSLSFDASASITENLSRFLVFTLTTSTITWDTIRAVGCAVGIVLVGRAVLNTLRRAKVRN